MSTPIDLEIAQVRKDLEAATARLKTLEEQARQPAVVPKWEPKGGSFFVNAESNVLGPVAASDSDKLRSYGRDYPTREAAESVAPYFLFYQRLCALAQELNPSGKVGGRYYVFMHRGKWSSASTGAQMVDSLFETEGAVDKAAEIMNRDGWKLPNT